MSGFDFHHRLPDSLADEDWRPIDRAVARWVLGHGGSLLLARVAAWASVAEGQGDSVLVLAGEACNTPLAALSDEALQALAAEPLVQALAASSDATPASASGDATAPSVQADPTAAAASADPAEALELSGFVLQGDLFYLRRNFAHEQAVAAALRARRRAPAEAAARESSSTDQPPADFERAGSLPADPASADRAARPAPAVALTDPLPFALAPPPAAVPRRAGLDPPPPASSPDSSHAGDSSSSGLDAPPNRPTAHAELPPLIDALFAGDTRAAVQAQRAAVAQFVDRRLFVLTGGPGTGKTTTVLRMLLLRVRRAMDASGRAPRLRLAAPTGKAAQRLAESLAAGGEALRTGPAALGADWQSALAEVLAAEASTLHRLLGSRGPGRGPTYRAGRPLPLDLLVVDEASMIDLSLLRATLDALPADASLLLVGDADQLASVGTGSVLRDLVEALADDPRGDLVRLDHSFRAQQALQPLNAALKAGDYRAFAAAATAAGPRFQLRRCGQPRELARALSEHAQALFDGLQSAGIFAPLPADPQATDAAVLRALAALRDRQLLCALRETEYGARAADVALAQRLKSRLHLGAGDAWFAGRAIIIEQNDYAAGLFNGDLGLCLAQADGSLRVWFEPAPTPPSEPALALAARPAAALAHDALARGAAAHGARTHDVRSTSAPRAFSPGSLPAHAGAFALSVHKSQGSEYEHVALLLPPEPEHPILSRALLYTGATRARSSLQLWASEAVLQAALSRPALRSSGLRARLLAESR
jgi:exodeoxyribonuclease V alpha subunit